MVEIEHRELLLVEPIRGGTLWPVLGVFAGMWARRSYDSTLYVHFTKPVIRLLEPAVVRGVPVNFAVERDRMVESTGYSIQAMPHVVVGKERILERLTQDEKLEDHVNWIKDLVKPYKIPVIRTVGYVGN